MKIKKSDKLSGFFVFLAFLSLIFLLFDYNLIGIILIIVFIVLFIIFAEPEIKKEEVNDDEEPIHSPEEDVTFPSDKEIRIEHTELIEEDGK